MALVLVKREKGEKKRLCGLFGRSINSWIDTDADSRCLISDYETNELWSNRNDKQYR
jgi:hypothetical protein